MANRPVVTELSSLISSKGSSHRQDSMYHGIYRTSCGTQAGTRNNLICWEEVMFHNLLLSYALIPNINQYKYIQPPPPPPPPPTRTIPISSKNKTKYN